MPPIDLLLRPRDPLLVRDARPFSAEPGARAFTLDWPLPGTLAGALRGAIGNAAGLNWSSQDDRNRALSIRLTGAFRVSQDDPRNGWEVFIPAPLDAVPYTDSEQNERLLHLKPNEGLPKQAGSLWPEGSENLLPVLIESDNKPDDGLTFWSFADLVSWLASPQADVRPKATLGKLPRDIRTHVAINRLTQTAEEGRLFSTEALTFSPAPVAGNVVRGDAIACRVEPPAKLQATSLSTSFVPLGGERRLTVVEQDGWAFARDPFLVPEALAHGLTGAMQFRLVLLTPAIFDQGWKPGTAQESGRLAALLSGAGLTLRSAVVGRRIPVSGWSLADNAAKATRFAAPAGSVFFLESTRPLQTSDVEALWMASISDREQDRRDGYGIAVPGIWATVEGV